MAQTTAGFVPAAPQRHRAHPAAFTHVMPARGVFGFDVPSDATIDCLSGELWVTGPGTGDQLLHPGSTCTIFGPGRVVVEALVASRLRITKR